MSKQFSLNSLQESCATLTAQGENAQIPLADVCVKHTPVFRRQVRQLAASTTTTENGVTVKSEEAAKVSLSACVPALFKGCRSVNLLSVKMKTKSKDAATTAAAAAATTAAAGGRRLGVNDEEVTFEIDGTPPQANSEVQEEEFARVEEKHMLQPAIIVFLAVFAMSIFSLILNACWSHFKNEQKKEVDPEEATQAKGRTSSSPNALKDPNADAEDPNVRSDRPSPIQLAKKANQGLFQRLSDQKVFLHR